MTMAVSEDAAACNNNNNNNGVSSVVSAGSKRPPSGSPPSAPPPEKMVVGPPPPPGVVDTAEPCWRWDSHGPLPGPPPHPPPPAGSALAASSLPPPPLGGEFPKVRSRQSSSLVIVVVVALGTRQIEKLSIRPSISGHNGRLPPLLALRWPAAARRSALLAIGYSHCDREVIIISHQRAGENFGGAG